MSGKPSPLQEARKAAQARAALETSAAEERLTADLTLEECLVQLAVACYAYKLGVGMGAMQDGSALWLRLRVPPESDLPCAGKVAFVVSDEPLGAFLKAVSALDNAKSDRWWKPDRFLQNGKT